VTGSPADTLTMSLTPEPGSINPARAHALRMQFRCPMCHKQCFIPCSLSRAQFVALERGTSGEPTRSADSEPE
jgi:hypothetical protein